ncbi:MAG TPA: acetyl-CoA C-acyltransferase [Phenylobacterium sp.]|jgi:acetyl-CoA C-acetyltransferase|uniref:acetyl-CoA C-acyltransferase n=1 Tax=Phenylobacterium sp. TaxID=1871053 RepID=UPI002B8CF115|nr:acetyl-CoA C-acyltransferase [Phenylobacterium sp.]HXA41173.1 acetyl-CoA C-acyltransferase [Phenylobacterium sp.]
MARAATKPQSGGKPGVWLAAGVRTPFAKAGGPLAKKDALDLSVPVVKAMLAKGGRPDLMNWGAVIPNLTMSNLGREALISAGGDPSIPASSTVMACSTSMMGAFQAAGMLDDGAGRSLALVGGAEAMSRIQIGLSPPLSDDLRRFMEARDLAGRWAALRGTRLSDVRLFIPQIKNRATGKSMGEHTEEMAKGWNISRAEQDELALASHKRAAAGWASGFFDDLVLRLEEVGRDTLIRPDTSLEALGKLKPAFDRTSGTGTLTAGNSSPLTDGAAAMWVATAKGLERLPPDVPRVRLVDYEVNAINLFDEYLLMAPAYSIPRLLARNGLTLGDVALWELHEAFTAQVATHIKAIQDPAFLKDKAKVTAKLGKFPMDRLNPHGGSTAIGHPFGATGARILSQGIKELYAMPTGSWGVVSICADGGQGTVALLRRE